MDKKWPNAFIEIKKALLAIASEKLTKQITKQNVIEQIENQKCANENSETQQTLNIQKIPPKKNEHIQRPSALKNVVNDYSFQDNCLICLEQIQTRSKIWVCRQCAIISHFSCISQWTEKLRSKMIPNSAQKSQDNTILNFSCPHCNLLYERENPEHTCFCGAQKNPIFSTWFEPNSCGRICNKLSDPQCEHPCQKVCHYGRCAPCDKKRVVDCYCRQSKVELECWKINLASGKSCGKVCQKKLNCGVHFCSEICHDGACKLCAFEIKTRCFCGKEEKVLACGQKFSCESACGKILDCGLHFCQKICHETESCEKCPNAIFEGELCFCGSQQICSIIGRKRKDCLEEKPSCGKKCARILKCGHECLLFCHQGECDCFVRFQRLCRCEGQTFELPCAKQTQPVLCNFPCGRKLDCQRHNCQKICCPLRALKSAFVEHECKQLCLRALDCGQHECTRKCHKGPCPPCDAFLSRPVSCACGKQRVFPPVLCGTQPPNCKQRCSKRLECGHECYFECHFGDCPKCEEIVDKKCVCGNSEVKTVKCGKKASCGKICGQRLKCGHKCPFVCHAKEKCEELCKQKVEMMAGQKLMNDLKNNDKENNRLQENGCFAKCGKKRKDCDHLCQEICHPETECPETNCLIKIENVCPCANNKTEIECWQFSCRNFAKITCDTKCHNANKLKVYYQQQKEKNQKFYYSKFLVNFGKSNLSFLEKTEEKIKTMFFCAEEKIDFEFDKVSGQKIEFLNQLLNRHYFLEINNLTTLKGTFMEVKATEKFIIPRISLSKYIKKLSKKKIRENYLPFEVQFKFTSLTIFDQQDFLFHVFSDHIEKIYAEENNGKIYLYLWKEGDLDFFVSALQNLNNNWSVFTFRTKNSNKIGNNEKQIHQGKQNILNQEKLDWRENSKNSFLKNIETSSNKNTRGCKFQFKKNLFEELIK